MRKLLFLSKVCLMAFILVALSAYTKNEAGNNGEVSGDYVDLGLSSGTKWKTANEKNAADVEYAFYTYDEAVSQFGSRLPTEEQWRELKEKCQWTWNGSGYKVTGPNGNSIILPTSGYRICEGKVYSVGSYGFYWSSTPAVSDRAWILGIRSDRVYMGRNGRCTGLSVRLVQN